MKPVNRACWTLVFLFVTLSIFGQSPKLLSAGRWEITLQNELPHRAAPSTFYVCIEPGAAERPEPPKSKASDPCKVLQGGVSGNVLSYSTTCGSKHESSVRITYHGDRYEGVVELTEDKRKLRQIITAKRVGPCDHPLPQAQE